MLKCHKYIYVLHEKISPHLLRDGIYIRRCFSCTKVSSVNLIKEGYFTLLENPSRTSLKTLNGGLIFNQIRCTIIV